MKMLRCTALTLCIAAATTACTTQVATDASTPSHTAQPIIVPMYTTTNQGPGKSVGTVTISESPYGAIFTPHLNLKGVLSTSPHGFHIHTTPSCDHKGMAANGHFDPTNSTQHLGPYDDKGHLGDLPALIVNKDGTATIPVLAPKIKDLATVKNHALMIHEGGDNYSDSPKPLGGGGGRMVCGVIPA